MLKAICLIFIISSSQVYAQTSTTPPAADPNVSKQNEAATAEKAKKYYNSFVYDTHGSCADAGNLWFRSTTTTDKMTLGTDVNGNSVFARMSLQLFADGTYYADYQEYVVTSVLPDGIIYSQGIFYKSLRGTWAITDNQLQMSGIGTATPHKTTPSEETMSVQFNTVINDARIVDKPMIIGKSLTTIGPQGVSTYSYCETKSK